MYEERKQTHTVLACINVDIYLCNPIKRCPAKPAEITLSTRQRQHTTDTWREMSLNLPNAVIVVSKLLIIEAKLIHKVSCHLLDLVV